MKNINPTLNSSCTVACNAKPILSEVYPSHEMLNFKLNLVFKVHILLTILSYVDDAVTARMI